MKTSEAVAKAMAEVMEIIEDLSPLLVEQNTTLSIFIDELQDLDSTSLEALLAVQHRANQESTHYD